jgi:hypothetical protein
MHSALEQTLRALSLPSLSSLHTPLPELGSLQEPEAPVTHTTESITARDPETSSQLQPAQETSSHIPIESLYELTRLRSLRGETVEEQPSNHDDFISRGLVPVDEAEKLFHFYQTQLDPYIYGLASKYKTLESLRRSSSLLTACICTVAASHQAGNGQLYETCNQEFRRLVSGSMFERRISLDYLRALVIGSYWLSDVSWTLAGLAVRRASDINLHKFYYRIIDSTNGFAQTPESWDPSDPEASIDPVRLWYLLYICDQHLSILYTRAPMIREDDTVRGWRAYLESPHASQSDVRISSQVALMTLLSQIREFFGVDASRSIPRGAMPHINTFSHHLDKWLAHWSSKLRKFPCASLVKENANRLHQAPTNTSATSPPKESSYTTTSANSISILMSSVASNLATTSNTSPHTSKTQPPQPYPTPPPFWSCCSATPTLGVA